MDDETSSSSFSQALLASSAKSKPRLVNSAGPGQDHASLPIADGAAIDATLEEAVPVSILAE